MKSVLSFLFFVVSLGTLFPQSKGSPLLDSIAKSISSKENLTIEWETSFMYGEERENASHYAKIKGSKYYHELRDLTIICDGQFVYKYYGKSNEVSISSVDTTVDYNPIKVLTFFINGYSIKSIKRYKTGKIRFIRIETMNDKANLIKEAFLYFDKTSGILSTIKFRTKMRFRNYVKIKKLNSSIILADSEFKIPK